MIDDWTGWPVHESLLVDWMRPLLLPLAQCVIAREAADLPARLAWDAVKSAMRADLEVALDGFADRVGVARFDPHSYPCDVCGSRTHAAAGHR